MGVLALRTDAVLKGTAPKEIMDLSSILRDNLYSKGETILPTTLDIDLMKEFGKRTYDRCSDNIEKRLKLGYMQDDARQTPIPEESLSQIRDIMRLTGYMEK